MTATLGEEERKKIQFLDKVLMESCLFVLEWNLGLRHDVDTLPPSYICSPHECIEGEALKFAVDYNGLKDWGDGSVSSVLSVQAWDPEFSLQCPHKCLVWRHELRVPATRGGGNRQIPV